MCCWRCFTPSVNGSKINNPYLLCYSLCRRNLHWRGVTIEYSHIADRLYFGFEARDGFNLAMPEKALLDCIYYRNAAPFEDELELEGVDAGRLQEMAQSFPVRVREIVGKLA